MHGAWRAGRIEDIRRYCETDVMNTYLLYCRYQQMRGGLTPAEHAAEMRLVRATLAAIDASLEAVARAGVEQLYRHVAELGYVILLTDSRGIAVHRRCEGISELVNDGDTIEMDFSTGRFLNVTTGATAQYAPVQKDLLETMLLGGTGPMLERWRDAHYKDTVPGSA